MDPESGAIFDLRKISPHRGNKDKIEVKVKRRKRSVVVLKKPIPVHLVYMTVWAEEDDTIYFYHDLYGRDRLLGDEEDRSGHPI